MRTKRTLCRLLPLIFLFASSSCVEESPVPVIFDQELESVTFENQLLSPIILFRNSQVLDTLEALSSRRYEIGQKGIMRHAWRLLAPRDGLGRVIGVEPYREMGVQYEINAHYTINNNSADRTLFTPRFANLSLDRILFFYANYREQDEFLVNKIYYPSEATSFEHAPYYYWNDDSNLYFDNLDRSRVYYFSRNDTLSNGEPELQLTDDFSYRGSGLTEPIIIQ